MDFAGVGLKSGGVLDGCIRKITTRRGGVVAPKVESKVHMAEQAIREYETRIARDCLVQQVHRLQEGFVLGRLELELPGFGVEFTGDEIAGGRLAHGRDLLG